MRINLQQYHRFYSNIFDSKYGKQSNEASLLLAVSWLIN